MVLFKTLGYIVLDNQPTSPTNYVVATHGRTHLRTKNMKNFMFYCNNYTFKRNLFIVVVALRMNKQNTSRFCDLLLNQDDLHG